MPVICAILWGLLTPAAMWAVWKYCLPRLAEIAGNAASDTNNEQVPVPGQSLPRTVFFRTVRNRAVTWIVCGVLSAVCGYIAADSAVTALSFIKMWLVFLVLACITVTDVELMLIPNKASLVLLGGGVVLLGVQWIRNGEATILASVVSLVICLILLLIMAWVTKGGFGMGDVKIISCVGFLCGIKTVCYVLTLSLFACALSSMLLLAVKKKHLKDLLPLGPFLWLAMGFAICLRLI